MVDGVIVIDPEAVLVGVEVAAAAAIAIVYACVDELVPFTTLIVKVEVATVVGVPEIVVVTFVEEVFNVSPAGRAPAEMLHVKVPVAVVEAVRSCENAIPCVPPLMTAGLMVMGTAVEMT
jgi:hypothetical protein